MASKKSVECFWARDTRGWKSASNVVQLFVCFLVDLLFGNGQHLAEVALDGSFHAPGALDVHQMPGAQNHKSGRGENHSEFEGQYESGSLIPAPFRFHRELLIQLLPGSARQKTYLSRTGHVSI